MNSQLFFRKVGEGDPVIILHGLFGFSDNWITVAKDLAKNYEVWTPDLRNHGRSFHSDEWSYEVMVSDVRKLILDQDISDPVLIGHSMGGKVAMLLALMYPDLLKKLMVVDIGPKGYPVHHQDLLDAMCELDLDGLSNRTEADDHLSLKIQSPGVRQFLLKNISRNENGKFEWKLNLPVIKENIAEVGREISIRDLPFFKQTMFVRGANSDYVLFEDFKDIGDIFPNCSVITVENSGHWVHAENTHDFLLSVKYFLET